MLTLLVIVFLLQLAIHSINTTGVATLNEMVPIARLLSYSYSNYLKNTDKLLFAQAWLLFNKLPTRTARDNGDAMHLRQRLFRLKKDLAGVSAQDDFANWAKLRRQHDKVSKEYEKACKLTGYPNALE